jgi:hypothetical protein
MKILVGIMHCIENEIEQCLESIDAQTLPAYDRFVISNRPNKEAHDTLYRTFMDRAAEVDLFIKVDADMVLARRTFFRECADKFTADPALQHLQIALNDWMTKRRIFGLHVYRSSHKWQRSSEAIFVDMVDEPHKQSVDATELAPAAIHCPDPSPFQAYHFGVHKGVKFVQKGRPLVHAAQRVAHWHHFENLEAHYRRTGDRRLALAVVGFHDAVRGRWGPSEVDFRSEVTSARFSALARLDSDALDREVMRTPFPGEHLLPAAARFELNRLRVGGDVGPRTLFGAGRRLWRRSYRRECPEVSRERW